MTTKVAQAKLKSEFYRCLLELYRKYPAEIAVCEANAVAIEKQLDAMLLPPTLENCEKAFLVVKDSLAEPAREYTAEEIAARVAEGALAAANKVAEEARQQKAHEEDKALRSFPRHNSEYWTKERIKAWFARHKTDAPVRGSLEERRLAYNPLPAEYTRVALVNMPLNELRALKQKYGLEPIVNRLNRVDE